MGTELGVKLEMLGNLGNGFQVGLTQKEQQGIAERLSAEIQKQIQEQDLDIPDLLKTITLPEAPPLGEEEQIVTLPEVEIKTKGNLTPWLVGGAIALFLLRK